MVSDTVSGQPDSGLASPPTHLLQLIPQPGATQTVRHFIKTTLPHSVRAAPRPSLPSGPLVENQKSHQGEKEENKIKQQEIFNLLV